MRQKFISICLFPGSPLRLSSSSAVHVSTFFCEAVRGLLLSPELLREKDASAIIPPSPQPHHYLRDLYQIHPRLPVSCLVLVLDQELSLWYSCCCMIEMQRRELPGPGSASFFSSVVSSCVNSTTFLSFSSSHFLLPPVPCEIVSSHHFNVIPLNITMQYIITWYEAGLISRTESKEV